MEIEPGESESELTVNGLIHQDESGHHYLRSHVNLELRSASHELFVSSRLTEPDQVFVRAEGGDTTPLTTFPIGSKWLGCPHGFCSWAIEWGVEFPDELLRSNLDGYSVRGHTASGTEVEISITRGQIWSQLAAADSLLVWGRKTP
ncbi:hypothetical protein ACFL3S_04765 [Gemmatimonadota bacterium]